MPIHYLSFWRRLGSLYKILGIYNVIHSIQKNIYRKCQIGQKGHMPRNARLDVPGTLHLRGDNMTKRDFPPNDMEVALEALDDRLNKEVHPLSSTAKQPAWPDHRLEVAIGPNYSVLSEPTRSRPDKHLVICIVAFAEFTWQVAAPRARLRPGRAAHIPGLPVFYGAPQGVQRSNRRQVKESYPTAWPRSKPRVSDSTKAIFRCRKCSFSSKSSSDLFIRQFSR